MCFVFCLICMCSICIFFFTNRCFQLLWCVCVFPTIWRLIILISNCFLTGPNTYPENVTGHATNSTSILVSWGEVPFEDQNGVIVGYTVTYKALSSESSQTRNVTVQARQATLTGLNEYTNYSITVFASTSKGGGIESTPIVVITDEDSKFVITEFAHHFVCALHWYHLLLQVICQCDVSVVSQLSNQFLDVFAILVLIWFSTICNCFITILYLLHVAVNLKMCFAICRTWMCSVCNFCIANRFFQLLQCVRIFQRIWWLIILICNIVS